MFGHFSMGSCGPTQKKKKKYYNTNNKAKKNKSSVSKLPRAFVFRCAFDSAKFKVWIFFCSLDFFFQFFMTCLSKNTRKDMTDTMKHFEQQTSSTFVFCLVSCSPKIKFHISKLWPTQIWRLLLRKKKNAFRSGLSICHELWDIAFIFFSLMKRKIIITLTSILYYLAFWDLNSWNQ